MLEKSTMAARYDEENVAFVEWLAKQADGGYGVKRSQVLNRGWSFLRALYMISEDELSFNCLQRLLSVHGLPQKGAAMGPGLASELPQTKQARLFFSRLGRRSSAALVARESAYKPPFAGVRFLFSNRSTRGMA